MKHERHPSHNLHPKSSIPKPYALFTLKVQLSCKSELNNRLSAVSYIEEQRRISGRSNRHSDCPRYRLILVSEAVRRVSVL
jgi:hypothetical protein